MTGDQLRIAVILFERCVAVRAVRRDDGDDLLRWTFQVGHADPVGGFEDLDRFAVRGQLGAVVDVVHALQLDGLPGVHLEDHPVGHVDPRLVVADRGGRDQCAVGGDAGDLDERHVEVTEEAFPDHLRNVRQVQIQVVEQPGVDLGAAHRVRLVGHAQVDPVDCRQCTVELGRGRRAGPDADGETVTALGRVGDATDQSGRNCLRIASTGEPAHPDVVSWRDERSGLFGRHHLVSDSLAPNT